MTTINNALRWDSAAMFFVREELAPFDPTVYYNLVQGMVGRRILPPVPAFAGVPIYRYAMTQLHGTPSTGANGRSASGSVISVTRNEFQVQKKKFDATMTWTLDDVRAIQAARAQNPSIPLDFLAQTVRVGAVNAIEQQIDNCLAFGVANMGITGLFNAPGLLTSTPTIKDGGSATSWFTAGVTPATMAPLVRQDLSQLIIDIKSTLGYAQYPDQQNPGVFDKFTIVLPPDHYTFIDQTPLTIGTTPLATTIRQFILNNTSEIADIIQWDRAKTGGAGGVPCAMAYPAGPAGGLHPLIGGGVFPDSFTQAPEQYEGWNVNIPCANWCGGTVLRHVLACRRMDGI